MRRTAMLIPFLAFTVFAAPGAHAQWTTGNLSLARQGLSATSAAGKAFFAGGRIGNTIQTRVDVYDQGSNTWSSTNLTVPRSLSSATSLGNLAFFGGGANAGGATASVEVYDAQSGTWLAPGALSVARFGLSAAAVGSKVIFAGGATGFPNPSAVFSNVVDIYDSTLGAPSNPAAWSTTTLSTARMNMGVAVCGNKAIFAGGHNATTTLGAVDIYDDIGGSWSTSTLPAPQIFVGASVGVGDHAYFCGGKTGTPTNQTVTGLVQIFDATNGTWTTTSLSQPRWSAGVAAVGSTLLVGGGSPSAGGGTSSVVDVLDTLTGTWLPTTSLSQPRTDLSATSLGTQALFAGGFSNVPAVSAVVDIYDGLVSGPFFCFGDGTGTACPCGNSGLAGNGCANSVNPSGANLSATGNATIFFDSFVLSGSGMPNSSALYFQGTTQLNGGLGSLFGDGLRCAGGTITRIGTKTNVTGASQYPAAGDPAISVRGLVTSPGTRTYQIWYRNSAAFCNVETFNLTNGLSVTWALGTPPGMVAIPAGTFDMGSNAAGGPPYYGGTHTQPVHQVTISYSFWMGQHEVTQSEYAALMGSNPSYFPGANNPVETVSWFNAQAYCAALTAQQSALGNVPAGYQYRLPTEAEWEYACRAGTTTEFNVGSGLFCNQAKFYYSYHSNVHCGSYSHAPVGSYAPNAWGLYDMHGSVAEWCLDSYADYSPAAVTDPFVTGGPTRVSRSGSWDSSSDYCRSANRGGSAPGGTDYRGGFRVVLAPALVP